MSKSRIEKNISPAIEIIKDEFNNSTIPEEYNGYISSLGAGIVQSGLLPTLAFYENKNSNSQQDRKKLTKMILKLIADNPAEYNHSLLKYVIAKTEAEAEDKEYLKRKIKDAAVAIKLALRTFALGDDNSES